MDSDIDSMLDCLDRIVGEDRDRFDVFRFKSVLDRYIDHRICEAMRRSELHCAGHEA